jgi:hypothetical protein
MDYIVPGLLGFLTGAVIFGLTYQQIYPLISAIANYGNTTIPDLWNVSSFLFIVLFTLMALLLFYLIDRVGWQRKDSEQ